MEEEEEERAASEKTRYLLVHRLQPARWQRPVDCEGKPGAGFGASQGCAGESAVAAELG